MIFALPQWHSAGSRVLPNRLFASAIAIGALAIAGAAQADPPSSRVSHFVEEYSALSAIQFDCLDGVRVDRASGKITLFGHRRSSAVALRIPYLDYLRTAMEYRVSPGFSFEPANGYYDSIMASVRKAGEVVKSDLHDLIDKKGKLNARSAWFLQQVGVPVEPGSKTIEVISQTMLVTGHDEAADLFQALDTANFFNNGYSPTDDMFAALGIADAIAGIKRAYKSGAITQEQEQDQFNTAVLRTIAVRMGIAPNKYTDLYADDRKKGMSPFRADEEVRNGLVITTDAVALLVRTIKEILQTKRELQMPDWLEDRAFPEGTPELHPTFINLTSTSWLARTIMLSDVALKSIVAIGPVAEKQLKAIVPGYVSEEEFLRAHGYPEDDFGASWGRVYIAPGAFEISEAPGGDALQFLKTPMAIHLVKMSVDAAGVAKDVPDAAFTQYGGTLSAAYDQFAIQFPTLYKLREAAKIVAIARWLQKHGITVSLPPSEALTWTPPRSVPTIMRPYLRVEDGGIRPVAYVVGGVNLAPDQNWKITNAPAAAPGGDTDAAVPAAAAGSATQADLERRIAGASDPTVKSGLQLDLAGALLDRGDRQGAAIAIDSAIRSNPQNSMLLILSAQAHFDAGDAAGAAQIMSKYLKVDPDNAPAQRMLAHFQQQPAQPASPPTSKGTITPFAWAGQVSRAYYSSDERAPELTDIHVAGPTRPSPVPPPPAVLDAIQLAPEVADFNQKRADLVRQYHEAAPSETPAIVAKIAAGDAAFAKKAAGLEASFGAAPQTGPAPVKPEEPKPDKKHKKAILQ